MTDWQPIETAPRDGTPIIVNRVGRKYWVEPIYDSGGGVVDVNYHDVDVADVLRANFLPDSGGFMDDDGLEYNSSGFNRERYNSGEIKSDGDEEEFDYRITHWQPLPAPPKETE